MDASRRILRRFQLDTRRCYRGYETKLQDYTNMRTAYWEKRYVASPDADSAGGDHIGHTIGKAPLTGAVTSLTALEFDVIRELSNGRWRASRPDLLTTSTV